MDGDKLEEDHMCARIMKASLGVSLLVLAACGGVTGPSKAEIKQVIQDRMQQANSAASARTLGLFDGPYDVKDFDVTNADCSAKDNGVYSCAVTSINKNQTKTGQLAFKKVNGSWTLVE